MVLCVGLLGCEAAPPIETSDGVAIDSDGVALEPGVAEPAPSPVAEAEPADEPAGGGA